MIAHSLVLPTATAVNVLLAYVATVLSSTSQFIVGFPEIVTSDVCNATVFPYVPLSADSPTLRLTPSTSDAKPLSDATVTVCSVPTAYTVTSFSADAPLSKPFALYTSALSRTLPAPEKVPLNVVHSPLPIFILYTQSLFDEAVAFNAILSPSKTFSGQYAFHVTVCVWYTVSDMLAVPSCVSLSLVAVSVYTPTSVIDRSLTASTYAPSPSFHCVVKFALPPEADMETYSARPQPNLIRSLSARLCCCCYTKSLRQPHFYR